jgi:hypothetical protein
VPERVRRYPFPEARLPHRHPQRLVNRVRVQMMPPPDSLSAPSEGGERAGVR